MSDADFDAPPPGGTRRFILTLIIAGAFLALVVVGFFAALKWTARPTLMGETQPTPAASPALAPAAQSPTPASEKPEARTAPIP